MPPGNGVQVLLAGVGGHIGHRRVVLVHVDRDERHVARGRPELVIGVHELLRHDRADVGAVRVHELQHHHLAAQGRQLHRPARLVGEGEAGGLVVRQRGQQHLVGEAGRDAGGYAGRPRGGRAAMADDDERGRGHRDGDHDGDRTEHQEAPGRAGRLARAGVLLAGLARRPATGGLLARRSAGGHEDALSRSAGGTARSHPEHSGTCRRRSGTCPAEAAAPPLRPARGG